MRKMFSQKQIEEISKSKAVEGLVGKDINVEGITSKGIANTGGLANIGDVAISGDLNVQGEGKGNISATGAITAKTLKQSEANYIYEFELNVTDTTNFEKTFEFARAEEVNGEIHIIYLGKFHNTDTENAHNAKLSITNIVLPSELASKIYDDEGIAVSSSSGGYHTIRVFPIGSLMYTTSRIGAALIRNLNVENALEISMSENVSVNANQNITFSFEINLSVMPSSNE